MTRAAESSVPWVSAGADAPADAIVHRPLLADAPALLVGLTMTAVFVAWGQKGGGYDPLRWMPGTLLAAGLLVAVLVGLRGVVRVERLQGVALASLVGLTIWSFASIAWADVRGDAWIGANRNLLYVLVFALFLLVPWTLRSAQLVVWAFAAGVTTVAALAVARAASTGDLALFVDGRLSYPTGYANANAALYMVGFWIALAVATRRSQPTVVRGLAFGAVAFLPQAALISQSRAAVVAVPLAALVVLVVAPGRLRTLLGLAVGVLPLVVGWNLHGEIYEQAEVLDAPFEDAIRTSALFMAATSVLAVVLGLGYAYVDRRASLPPRVLRAVRLAAVVAGVAAVLAASVLVARGDPVDRVRTAWDELTTNESEYDGSSRFGGFDSERWDEWRVGVERFLDHPVAGIGVEQFNVDYLRERRTSVDARYAHSLPVGVVSQLGLVGGILFGTFVVVSLWLIRPRTSDEPVEGTIRLGAFSLFVYWLVHSSVDWFYEIPAVTASVLAFVALASTLGAASVASTEGGRRRSYASVAAAVAVAVVTPLTILAPYLAAREVQRAASLWAREPATAYALLERARTLNPLSDEPDVYAGAIATRRDDRARMRLHFAQALERNPHNWYARLHLGLTHSLDARHRAALREVRYALRLNPTEPVLRDALKRLERGETVTPRSVDRLFADRLIERFR